MGAHGGQPFEGGEYLAGLAIFGRIDDLPLLIQVLHALLRSGCFDLNAGAFMDSWGGLFALDKRLSFRQNIRHV
jgi:hypothetical protein